jgi:hypothetical protein
MDEDQCTHPHVKTEWRAFRCPKCGFAWTEPGDSYCEDCGDLLDVNPMPTCCARQGCGHRADEE